MNCSGLRTAGAAALVLASMASAADARDLRIAMGLTETYAAYQPLAAFSEAIAAGTSLTAKVYPMSLLTLPETAGGVRDGLADAGFVIFPYDATGFSELNLIAELSMLATAGDAPKLPSAAMTGASMEYTLLHCADCLAQFKDYNQVYIAGAATTPYEMLCNQPISSVADLAGKRLRSGASNWSRWAEAMDAAPVSMPGNDTYDALSQGVVTCSMSPIGDLIGNRYVDVVSNLTVGAPGGIFSGLGAANFNRDTWQSFSEDDRRFLLKTAAKLASDMVVSYRKDEIAGYEAAEKKGVVINRADAGLIEKSAEFARNDTATIADQFTSKYNLANVDAKIETFRGLIEKWRGLTTDIDETQGGRLTELYWQEVLSKVDAASYAMD